MDERKLPVYASIGAAAAAFIVYMITLAPSVGFIDSGELATVAHTFGIAHPTGYPLYSILAGLWAKLPIGDGIYRLNVLSAVFCAAGVGVFVRLIYMLLGIRERERTDGRSSNRARSSQAKAAPPKAADFTPHTKLVAAVFGALVIAFSETYWMTALSNEVYPLHVLFIALVLYFFTAAVFVADPDSKQQKTAWLLFALVLGLSFANHMTTIMFAPPLLIIFFWRYGLSKAAWRKVAIAAPAFILGLVPYAYLPLRAASQPFMNWGNPQNWENFIRHVSGKQYQVWIFSGESTGRQFKYFWSSFPGEFAIALVALVVLGLAVAYMRHRKLGATLVVMFVTCLFYSINYDIYDIDSYFLMAYVTAGIWAAFGLAYAAQKWLKSDARHTAGAAALGVGLLIGVHWGGVSESGNYLVEDYTKNMLHSMRKNAVVVSYQWDFWVSASMYYQEVESIRPDIIVLDKELFRRSWYITHIQKHFPELYEKSREEFEAFSAELFKFERDLPYDPRMIEGAFQGLINSIIDNAYVAGRPVYLTIEMEQEFGPGYTRIPEGMAFRLYRPEDVPSLDTPVWDDFAYRPFDRSGRLHDALRDFYANMLTNRGMLYFQEQRYDEAQKYFERGLTYAPENQNARMWLGRSQQAKVMGALAR